MNLLCTFNRFFWQWYAAGKVEMYQVLWKGNSERFYGKMSDALRAHMISKVIVQDHAAAKTQPHATFEYLAKFESIPTVKN